MAIFPLPQAHAQMYPVRGPINNPKRHLVTLRDDWKILRQIRAIRYQPAFDRIPLKIGVSHCYTFFLIASMRNWCKTKVHHPAATTAAEN